MRGTVALADEVVDLAKNFVACATGHGLHDFFENVRGGGADQVAHGVGGEPSAGGSNGLIENGERVAHGAVAGFGEQGESVVVGFDVFARHQVAKLADDGVELHGAETEMLAARADGLRNVLRLRGREHEDDVIGRFFQRLEQGVEGGVGDLVGFVENVDFEAVAGGTVTRGLAEFADFVDAAVGGGVDFDHVDGVAGANFGAGFADAAGLGYRMIFFRKPERQFSAMRQNAGDCGFADAAVSAEDVAVGGASLFDGVLQGAGDVLLSDDLGELLRTVLAGQDGVAHGREETIIRDGAGELAGLRDKSWNRRVRGEMPRRSRRTCAWAQAEHLLRLTSGRRSSGLLSRRASDRLVRRDYAVAIRLGGVWLLPARRSVLMQLKITKKTIDGILIFECNGRIVFGEESSLLREQVKSAIPDNKRIVLNLGEVNYIDSGGLGTLVALHTTGLNAGTTIKLANLTKRVGDLLQVTKLLTVFDVCNSESEAIESFRKVA